MKEVKYILFDAANTLIHKPALWQRINAVLVDHGYNIPEEQVKRTHKIVSEIINFPDKTSEEFYLKFNSKLLFALGIIPSEKILKDLFNACTYLPWQAFADSNSLRDIKIGLGVISNFNKSLEGILKDLIPVNFSHIIISENYSVRKPAPEFYKLALNSIGCTPSEILYIGDSLELDIYPAKGLGINTCLIDREGFFPLYQNRISSCEQINEFIKKLKND